MSRFKMMCRDQHATINGKPEEITVFPNGIEILAEDGKALFDIDLLEDGSIEISGGNFCKFKGKLLDDNFKIQPLAYNRIKLVRNEHVRSTPNTETE